MHDPKCVAVRAVFEGPEVSGELLVLDEPLSYWGGLCPLSGRIIDAHHPQSGLCVTGLLLVMPGTRGSTASPGALLETLYSGYGPAAIITPAPDIATLLAVYQAQCLDQPPTPVLTFSDQQGTWGMDVLHTGDRWRYSPTTRLLTPLDDSRSESRQRNECHQ
ncbi:MAG: DUF126 domain-containing protein [Pseudomonadota bacterium]